MDGLAAVLDRRLAAPQEMQRLGLKGRRLAQERYTWLAVGKRMAACIREVLAGTAPLTR